MTWTKINGTFENDYDYNELNREFQQPTKQHMRLRWTNGRNPQIEWYSDLGHGWDRAMYSHIEGYVRKSVGSKFSEVYSKFLKKFPDTMTNCWGSTPRDHFLEYFRDTYRRSGIRKYNNQSEYIIDENDIIHKNPNYYTPKYRRNYVNKYLPRGEWYNIYKLNKDRIERFGRSIRECISYTEYLKLLNAPDWLNENDFSEYATIIKKITLESMSGHGEFDRSYCPFRAPSKVWNFFVDCSTHNIEATYYKGTHEYYEYIRALDRQKRKLKKHRSLATAEHLNTLHVRKQQQNASKRPAII